MKLEQTLQPQQKQIQTLSLMLNPEMLTMLNFFNLPYNDLIEKINEEVNLNPALEIKKPEQLIEYIKSFQPKEKTSLSKETERFNLLENTAAPEGLTLEQFLINQLKLAQLKPKDFKIGLELINYIDDRGYINNYYEARREITKKIGVSRQKVDEVLKIIQDFEPDGIGARNLKECLLLQVRNYLFENDEIQKTLEKAINDYYELIISKNLQKLSEVLKIPEEDSQKIINFVENNLNPNPGSKFGPQEELRPIIPSYSIEWINNELKITNLEDNFGPQLGLNSEYLKILESGQADQKTITFIQEKIKKAENFIKNLERRKNTLQKIVEEICFRQKNFFKEGINWLEPFPQKELAKTLDLHPSIVSRAIAHKYIQTPKGIYNLKFLCPRDFHGFTPQKIKAKIQSIIQENITKKPLSDNKICQLLNLAGIKIKRRTVTKYRREMNLPSSHSK